MDDIAFKIVFGIALFLFCMVIIGVFLIIIKILFIFFPIIKIFGMVMMPEINYMQPY